MSYFSPVDNVLNYYHKNYGLNQFPIGVDDLLPFFEEIGYVDKILWKKLPLKTKYILAEIETYKASMGVYGGTGEHANIRISADQNPCWTRFILCKEMYHCIIDRPKRNRVANFENLELISNYLSNEFLASLESESAKSGPFKTELQAEILALETLFPYELRCYLCDGYDNKTLTSRKLALAFKIPEYYIPIAMSSPYFSLVSDGRNLIKI